MQKTNEPGATPIYTLNGEVIKEIKIPKIFSTPVRLDLIRKAVVAVQSTRLQPKGRDPAAGKKTSAKSMGVGLGTARIPRVKGRGSTRSGQGAFAPGTVGGRLAHPPKVAKTLLKKINKKERRSAIRSAIAATADKNIVLKRGHKVPEDRPIPIILEDELENVRTARDIRNVLFTLGLEDDLKRVKNGSRIRSGKGKMRGRKRKQPKGPLIVVDKDNGIRNAASNIPGVDVVFVKRLNAEMLAPGTHPGRLTLWSEAAVKRLHDANLFS
ncbi:MAG: 50S ribosomal protein L4 [Candidatus Bathyarchaeota archaeon]